MKLTFTLTPLPQTEYLRLDARPAPDPADLPDLDRDTPAAWRWVESVPLRPMLLGESADHPDLHPLLATLPALEYGRFRSQVALGRQVGLARARFDQAAVDYALAASLHRSPHLAVALSDAARDWHTATEAAAHDLIGAHL